MTVERIPITSRDEWLAMRRNDVTASDVAAVCGVDPQRTALQVYAEKIGIFAGRPDEAIMRRGRWLEPAVIEALADLRPEWETRRARVYLRDDTIRIGASPDVVAIDPERDGVGNVQCKVVARPVFLRDWCHDGNGDGPVAVPLAYQLQTLTEAMLMGATWAVVAALVIDTYSADLVVEPVELHAGAWDQIRAAVSRFWADVAAGQQPRADYERDAAIIREIYPRDDGGILDLSSDNMLPPLLAERRVLKQEIAERERRVDAIDTEVKAKLGAASEATLPGWKISYRLQKRAEMIIPAKEFRTLRIRELQEGR